MYCSRIERTPGPDDSCCRGRQVCLPRQAALHNAVRPGRRAWSRPGSTPWVARRVRGLPRGTAPRDRRHRQL